MTVYICKGLNSTVNTHRPAAVQLDLWLCGCLGEHLRSSTTNSSCSVQLSFMTAILCASWAREQWDTRPVWVSHANTFNTFSPKWYNKVLFSSFVHGGRKEVLQNIESGKSVLSETHACFLLSTFLFDFANSRDWLCKPVFEHETRSYRVRDMCCVLKLLQKAKKKKPSRLPDRLHIYHRWRVHTRRTISSILLFLDKPLTDF